MTGGGAPIRARRVQSGPTGANLGRRGCPGSLGGESGPFDPLQRAASVALLDRPDARSNSVMRRSSLLAIPLLALAALGALGTGSCTADPSAPAPSEPTYTVGGIVTGLTGQPLVLRLNGGNDLTLLTSGAFTFDARLADGAAYSVTIASTPAGETCSVNLGSGTIAGTDVTNVAVVCSTASYTVGGNVSGLSGIGLRLSLNGGEKVTINGDGAYAFTTPLANGAAYSVAVVSEPVGEQCTLANATGAIAGADVTNVDVTCAELFNVGGVVVGLSGGSLVLQLNGGDDVTLTSDGTFVFPTPLADGSPYAVAVASSPPGVDCLLNNASGTITGDDASVAAICAVAVSGLVGTDDSAHSVYGSVNAATGSFTTISSNLPFDSVEGLAYDAANARVFGSDTAADRLVAIDPFFGTSTDIGALGFDTVAGLGVRPRGPACSTASTRRAARPSR